MMLLTDESNIYLL